MAYAQDFDEGEEYVPNSRVLANGDDLGRSLHGEPSRPKHEG